MKRVTSRHVGIMRAAFPECTVVHGWHLAGPGPARYGWAAVHPSGRIRFLGRTASAAVHAILSEIDARNAAIDEP